MESSSFDLEKNGGILMLSDGPSALEEEKQETGNTSISKGDDAKSVELAAQVATEYPQGTGLALVVVVVVLSIFLASSEPFLSRLYLNFSPHTCQKTKVLYGLG